MGPFGVLEVEPIVQVGDKTRMDYSKSYPSKEISFYEISFDGTLYFETSGGSFDCQFDTNEEKTVYLRITDLDDIKTVSTKKIKVLSKEEDALFSDDSDLTAHEPDILKYVAQGRNSFLNIHREAQLRILETLDQDGYTTFDGKKITKEAFVDKTEVRSWSKFLTLQLIFEGLSNAIDDIFSQKAKKYESDAYRAKNRAYLRYDFNKDGELTTGETLVFSSIDLVRR